MSAILFIDFDAGLSQSQGSGPDPLLQWSDFAKPPGLFHYNGVVGQSQSSGWGASINGVASGRTANSGAIGEHSGPAGTYTSNGGLCTAVKRSVYSIGSEIWVSADLMVGSTAFGSTTTTTSGTNSTDKRTATFRWGDISVWVKSSTLVVTTWTIVFSIKNAGSEIATITVPNVVLGVSWLFFKMNCKLHASTGYIVCTIDGVAMSAAYTGQNTVAVNALADTGTTDSPDHIFFGPPCLSGAAGGTTSGRIDNVYIDDASHPTGRPRGERVSLGASSTDTNCAAVGTGATTVTNALNDPVDAKAARFTGAAASTVMDLATYSTTGLESGLIGFNLYAKRPASRDPNVARFLSMGVDISGTPTMGTLAVAVTLPVSSVTVPPNTDYPIHGLFEKIYNASITTSNLADVKIKLLTS